MLALTYELLFRRIPRDLIMCVEYPKKKENHIQRIMIYREKKANKKHTKKKKEKKRGSVFFFPSYKSLYRAVSMPKVSTTVFRNKKPLNMNTSMRIFTSTAKMLD